MTRFEFQSLASHFAFSAFCCRLFGYIFNMVVWRVRYKKKKEVVWTKVLADLAGNFCSFSESKRTESETALTAIQHLILLDLVSAIRVRTHDRTCTAIAMRTRTHNVATPIIVLNFRGENFRDLKSNHEIHENSRAETAIHVITMNLSYNNIAPFIIALSTPLLLVGQPRVALQKLF
jgi:hypothetical protein